MSFYYSVLYKRLSSSKSTAPSPTIGIEPHARSPSVLVTQIVTGFGNLPDVLCRPK